MRSSYYGTVTALDTSKSFIELSQDFHNQTNIIDFQLCTSVWRRHFAANKLVSFFQQILDILGDVGSIGNVQFCVYKSLDKVLETIRFRAVMHHVEELLAGVTV